MQTASVHDTQRAISRYPDHAALTMAPELPDDPLSRLMLALEQAGQNSLALGETRLSTARDELKESLAELVEHIRAATEKARKAEDDGGWFSDIVDSVASFVGKVVGVSVDAILPIDTAVALVEGFANGDNVMNVLKAGAIEAVMPGDTASKVGGFTEGVVKFSADLGAFSAKFSAALARAAVTGENPKDLIAADAKELWGSFKENILENKDFWAVVSAAAKAASVAGAVMTGGAAIGALVIIAALEVDARTNFIESAVGEDLAPWVKGGLAVAAAACTFGAGLGADGSARLLNGIAAGLDGAASIGAGYNAIVDAERQADALDASAETLEMLNHIQQMQRLVQQLVDALEGDHEDHTKTRELGSDLMRTRATTNSALIVPA